MENKVRGFVHRTASERVGFERLAKDWILLSGRWIGEFVEHSPEISVVIPCYNAERFLRHTLESVENSIFRSFEVVVVDDVSTDASKAIATEFIQGRNQYRLVEAHRKLGEAGAVNLGIESTTGRFILVLSADDLIHPELLRTAMAAFKADPEVAVVYPDWEEIDSDGQVLQHHYPPEFDYELLVGSLYCLPGPGTVFAREALDGQVARRPECGLISDMDLWVRLSLKVKFLKISGVLASWRNHQTNQTWTISTSDRARQERRMLTDHARAVRLANPHLGPVWRTGYARSSVRFGLDLLSKGQVLGGLAELARGFFVGPAVAVKEARVLFWRKVKGMRGTAPYDLSRD